VEIRLLGAVEAYADGVALPLGGPRQRAVLADLALHAGQPVSAGRLVDDLWGGEPPASARHTLETYVSRLRHVLNPVGGSLVTRPGGYLLDAAPGCVDAYQFRDLVTRGTSARDEGDVPAAVTLLGSAVKLWRGPALADVQDAPFAMLAGQQLEEERLTATEKLVEARLALGGHRELMPELEALIAGSPYREGFHAQLMLALYRSGRQAEALAAFGRARDLLASELGIEPGPELRRLHSAVLLQAPELQPDGTTAGSAPRLAAAPVNELPDQRPPAPAASGSPLARRRPPRRAAARCGWSALPRRRRSTRRCSTR
jgi:DNA-binding SARP family transcriptional activator